MGGEIVDDNKKTRERWDEILTILDNSVDPMDVDCHFNLHRAMTEIDLCYKQKEHVDFKEAFDALRKLVLEEYVDDSTDVDNDPWEDTYHLMVYYELGRDKEETFKSYLTN